MSDLLSLRLQYGNAAYQVARYQHEMELLKAKIDAAAEAEARDACAEPEEDSPLAVTDDASTKTLLDHFADGRALRGIRSGVADELGISRQHVYEVAKGTRRSARVSAALDRAYAAFQKAGRK